jgi:hypothetical protein
MTMHEKLARLRELNEADLDQLLQPFGRGISRNMAIQMITAIESMNGTIDAQAKKIEELASALDRRLQQDLPHIILPELQKKMAAQAKKIETLKAACIISNTRLEYPGYDSLPEEDWEEKRDCGKDDFYLLQNRGKKTLRKQIELQLAREYPEIFGGDEKHGNI